MDLPAGLFVLLMNEAPVRRGSFLKWGKVPERSVDEEGGGGGLGIYRDFSIDQFV